MERVMEKGFKNSTEARPGKGFFYSVLRLFFGQLKTDFLVFKSYPLSLYFSFLGMIGQVLFVFLLDKIIESGKWAEMSDGGLSYFQFAFGGLLFWNFSRAIGSLLPRLVMTQYRNKRLAFFILSPVGIELTTVSKFLFPLIFQLMNLAIMLFSINFFLEISFPGLFGFEFYFQLLSIFILFLAMGLISSSLVIFFKRSDVIQPFLGYISTFLSGIYFPLSILPEPLQVFSKFLPHTWAVLNLRSLLYQKGNTVIELGTIFTVSILFLIIGLIFYRLAFNFQRKRGEVFFF